jgi:mannose-1-phosphate guanylyltransferase / mannose-6-phosphate isomerase
MSRNSMTPIIPVILSGGGGSRLWPLSTQNKPKQFHALHGHKSMFAETLARVARGPNLAFGAPIIVCGADHLVPVCSELIDADIADATVILEPVARNTAPALAAAALVQAARDPDALMLILPADHIIERPDRLHQACSDTYEVALLGKIVTFSVKPQSAETSYGYIKSGDALGTGVYSIEAFKEKPDLATAQTYLNAGNYAWNAGIFFFKASALIDELAIHAPQLLARVRASLANAITQDGVLALEGTEFGAAPSISIDYAVMELTDNGAVVSVDMGWSDVGSFASLWELGAKDADGNVAKGKVALFDSTNCYANTSGTPVAMIGVSNLVVITTPQGILITPRDRAQDVRLAAQAFKV